jgi:uncharacterized cofD-like protein
MHEGKLNELSQVVALGGGHGLGRVMSSLAFLGNRLTGIVTTTDNGGSTGRIRRSQGGIAWGDTRNCLNQLITEPSTASAMFEYRFAGHGELAGHNLGNLMLYALDNLSVRPLQAIDLLRELLKIEARLIPMSEQSVDLAAIDEQGQWVLGEVNVDKLSRRPQSLLLTMPVSAPPEALQAIAQASLLLIGPGSFFTSLLPILLMPDLADAIFQSQAPMIYIGNLGKELSPAASSLTLEDKLQWMEKLIGRRAIDAVILSPASVVLDSSRLVIQQPLNASDVIYRHDRDKLRQALALALEEIAQQDRGYALPG